MAIKFCTPLPTLLWGNAHCLFTCAAWEREFVLLNLFVLPWELMIYTKGNRIEGAKFWLEAFYPHSYRIFASYHTNIWASLQTGSQTNLPATMGVIYFIPIYLPFLPYTAPGSWQLRRSEVEEVFTLNYTQGRVLRIREATTLIFRQINHLTLLSLLLLAQVLGQLFLNNRSETGEGFNKVFCFSPPFWGLSEKGANKT